MSQTQSKGLFKAWFRNEEIRFSVMFKAEDIHEAIEKAKAMARELNAVLEEVDWTFSRISS